MRDENASRGSAGSLLPDGDVLRALARERLPVPAAPALAQPHPGHARHQVELLRPDVAERRRAEAPVAVNEREVMRDEPLALDVVLVDPDMGLAEVEHVEALSRRERPKPRHADLDHEAA